MGFDAAVQVDWLAGGGASVRTFALAIKDESQCHLRRMSSLFTMRRFSALDGLNGLVGDSLAHWRLPMLDHPDTD